MINKNRLHWSLRAFLVAFCMMMAFSVPARGADVSLNFLYNLSDFNGPLPYSWVRLAADKERKELYVINPADLTVGVFNSAGMNIYSFGDEGEFGNLRAMAIGENGEMFILTSSGAKPLLLHANFRGEIQGNLTLSGLPPMFSADFNPDRIFYREGHLYLVDTIDMKVLVTNAHGKYEDGYDLGALLEISEKKKKDTSIVGFNIDRGGNLLFTIPVLSQVYVVSPDRKIKSFGQRGSSPGKFNIVGGVAADENGYLYVADTLRCVILVFDRENNFAFKGQFAERGFDPGNLIAPMEIVVLGDMLYVAQSANRGVSVYRIVVK